MRSVSAVDGGSAEGGANLSRAFMAFACACGYKEEIGVGVAVGISFVGTITMVCPSCLNIVVLEKVTVVNRLTLKERKP